MSNHLSPFKLLPVAKGTCPQCATAHEPELPHNQQSITYQYWFYNEHGRWPTWVDAMAHCSDDMRDWWTAELASNGIVVEGNDQSTAPGV